MNKLPETVLAYIEKDNSFLMLYRNKKKNDINANKWIGVGGHIEKGETPIDALYREIKEETGLDIKDTDKVEIMNPFLFSTPGMTDESNGLVCAVIENADFGTMNQEGAVGTEVFDGFELLTKEDAQKLLKAGCDKNGIFYSIFTWAALMYFVNEMY